MQKKIALLCVAVGIAATGVWGQTDTTQNPDLETRLKTRCEERKEARREAEQAPNYRKFFIGSSGMMLGNIGDADINFYQFNFGYRLSPKDVISLEAITWNYSTSLGIPYGSSFDAPEEKFPGSIREFGLGIAYQRFLWKGLYAAVHALNAHQTFLNEDKQKIKNGYQLFMTYRVGYHVSFFKNRFFIEPSIAVTHRPFHTKMPENFAVLDDKWSKFFFGEPGLHFGFKF